MKNILAFTKKNWVLILIVLVVLTLVMITINKKRSEAVVTAGAPSGVFPLTEGSSGTEVMNLQKYLNTKGETLVVDGKFGPLTRAAVQRVFGRMLIGQKEYEEIILKNI